MYERLPLGQVTKVGRGAAGGAGWARVGTGAYAWELRIVAGNVLQERRLPRLRAIAHPRGSLPLSAPCFPQVLKKLRRLPWAASEPYLLKTLVRASYKGRFSQIPHIASLAAGLARYHPSLGVALVDEVLESVAAGLEAPDAGA